MKLWLSLLVMYTESMLKYFVLVFVFLGAGPNWAQQIDGRAITQTLCSPEFHGRGYVNGGDSIAAEFIAQNFDKIGLKPLPGQTDYFQRFRFDVNTFPGRMSVRLNNRILTPGKDFIVSASSGSYTGKLDLREINVSVLRNQDEFNGIIEELKFDNAGEKGCLIRTEGANDDEKRVLTDIGRELSSLVPVVQLFDAKFTWSVSQKANVRPHVLLRDSLWTDGSGIVLDIENLEVKNHQAKNVIGYVPAKRKSKKYIFLTAHYDHLGRMGSETYFPGANDNASGTAILLRLAEAFKAHPMKKYNVVFVAFAGEEAGLVGSKYYVENPIVPLSQIRFLLNTDIMGSGEEGITVVNGSVFQKDFDRLVEINEEKKYLSQVKIRGKAANSDHYFFSENGVPAFFIYTMGPNKNYHDIFDLYQNLSFAEFDDLTLFIQDFLRSF